MPPLTGGAGCAAGARSRCKTVARDPLAADPEGAVARRDLLMRSLATLPHRQRAVLVLRYWEDHSEAEVAAMMGCSVGAVKSQASRRLARLRQLAGVRDGEAAARAEGGGIRD